MDQDLFLTMGGMAWAFNMTKKRRADGSEVPVHWNEYTPLLIAKPAPFEFDAVVRSEKKAAMLEQMWETGKGEDDEEEERNRLVEQSDKSKRRDDLLSQNEDDGASDRGSETSAAAGSLTESVGSVSTGSDSDVGESDGSTPGPELKRRTFVPLKVDQ